MKNIVLLVLLIFLTCCNKSKDKEQKLKDRDSAKSQSLIDNKVKEPVLMDDSLKGRNDRILIYGEKDNGFYVDYSRNDLDRFETLFPFFKAEHPLKPSIAYKRTTPKSYINKDGKEEIIGFESELGKDEFCLLYAYYLKQKNGEANFKEERVKLIQLYNLINDIYVNWAVSLLYHDHQGLRLESCVEYSIYRLRVDKKAPENYSFEKEKETYISSLCDYMNKEEKRYTKEASLKGVKMTKEEMLKREKEQKEQIITLQKLITNHFYLEQVQNFETEYYGRISMQ